MSLFFGSGALEQAVGDPRAVAADANADLRALYDELQRDEGDQLFAELVALDQAAGRTTGGYGAVRAARAELLTPSERAARFLWLVGTAWNGLWRVNKSGHFNVPCDKARLARPWPFPGPEDLALTAKRLPKCRVLRDWRDALARVRPGDLVLADPPYMDNFDGYCAARFPLEEQRALASALRRVAEEGAAVLAFNSLAARPLYERWASVGRVPRSGRINSDPANRSSVDEMVAFAGWAGAGLFTPREMGAPIAPDWPRAPLQPRPDLLRSLA